MLHVAKRLPSYWFQAKVISVGAVLLIFTYFFSVWLQAVPICWSSQSVQHYKSQQCYVWHISWPVYKVKLSENDRGNESWVIWETPYVIFCVFISSLPNCQDLLATGAAVAWDSSFISHNQHLSCKSHGTMVTLHFHCICGRIYSWKRPRMASTFTIEGSVTHYKFNLCNTIPWCKSSQFELQLIFYVGFNYSN